eukprot:GILJ01003865.1.p1 GENE.GILJ01003865.1~~GILJ01003865.1.p1  ORF type:complete len:294 (-),score=20.66 GILJ01003865.1:249-1130(-)
MGNLFERGIGPPKSMREFSEKYKVGRTLGRGTFSVVKLVTDKHSHQDYAAKVINKEMVTKKSRLQDEITILGLLRHPHIIRLHELFEDPDELYMILDLVRGGELFDRIVKKKFYPEIEAKQVIRNLLDAVIHCHSHNVIHRDLKPENILLTSDTNDTDIKLSDFGLAKVFSEEELKAPAASGTKGTHRRAFTACGTDFYVAPEVIKEQGYDFKVDVWGVGVITYILLCGFPPFYSEDLEELYRNISRGAYNFPSPHWDHVSLTAKGFVNFLLQVDPLRRPTAAEARAHGWLNS